MKILIFYSVFGSGHKKAAEAIGEAFLKTTRDVEVKVMDSLVVANPLFRWISIESFTQVVKRAPSVWGYFYETLDNKRFHETSEKFFEKVRVVNLKKLVRLINDWKPDAIVCTHWMSLHLIGRIKHRIPSLKYLYSVLTDYTCHRMQIGEKVDKYFVPTDKVGAELIHAGTEPEKIEVTGIPIDLAFLAPANVKDVRARLGLEKDTFTVLVISLWTDEGLATEIIKALENLNGRCQYIFVAGNNQGLRKEVEKMSLKKPHCILGYINNMPEIMSSVDVIVGKAGGLVVSEALAVCKPIVIINPMQGQEERNCDYILEIGAGTKIYHPRELEYVIINFIKDRAYYESKVKNCLSHARPRAAYTIAQTVCQELEAY